MNERIRLLAEQANLLYPSLGPTVQTHHMKKKEQDIEKFAMLIAKECASVVSSVQPCFGDYRDQIEENMRDFCAKKVLTHFGVLE